MLRKNKSLQILGVSDVTAIPLSQTSSRICLVLHFKEGSRSWLLYGPACTAPSDRAVTVHFPFAAVCSSAPCCVPPWWPLI